MTKHHALVLGVWALWGGGEGCGLLVWTGNSGSSEKSEGSWRVDD